MFEDLPEILIWILPWEFSATIAIFFSSVLILYIRGLKILANEGKSVSLLRSATFIFGLLLCYAVMHTQYDYYAQYMFFIHRIQHLILHHLGPFLMALSLPLPVLAKGMPASISRSGSSVMRRPLFQASYRIIQFPPLAAFLFVGLIFFWLTPEIHFAAMLNRTFYHVMNWSMFLDGLLFWWLILNPKVSDGVVTLKYGWRIFILILIMVPQIILGATITLSKDMIFDVYEVCGRAWPIDPMTDQIIGGIVTWIPPAMMSVIGVLIMLYYMSKSGKTDGDSEQPGTPKQNESSGFLNTAQPVV